MTAAAITPADPATPAQAPAHPGAEALSDWLAHCALSIPQPVIATARGASKSTILRRIRKVEALSDCPAWGLALEGLQSGAPGWLTSRSAPPDLGPGDLVQIATGWAMPSARAGLIEARAELADPAALVVLSRRLPKAGITNGPEMRPIERDLALAWLLMGWLVSGRPAGGLARLSLTAEGRAVLTGEARPAPAKARGTGRGRRPGAPDADVCHRLGHAGAHGVPAATRAILDSLIHDVRTPVGRSRLAAALPEPWVGFMAEVLGPGARMQAVEAAHGLPARSGKALLRALADVLAHHETRAAPRGPGASPWAGT